MVTPSGVLDDAAVHIAGGRIEAIAPATGPVDHDILSAGFVDLQVNGVDDVDVATASDPEWGRLRALLAAQGVTSWCPTLVSAPLPVLDARMATLDARLTTQHPTQGAVAVGIHVEGPFLGGAPGAHRSVEPGPIDPAWPARLPATVRVVTLAPEHAGAPEAIRALAARGVVVALGHTTASHEQTEAAIDAGARLFTHVFNASGAFHHRAPGALGAALTDDRIAVSVIADGVHVHPAALRLAWRAKPAGSVVLVTDAVAWRAGRLADAGVAVADGAPRLADGTLAGSVVTMADALAVTVREAGVDLLDALGAATWVPARLLGLDDRGAILPGRRADIVALTDDLEVAATWVAGERQA